MKPHHSTAMFLGDSIVAGYPTDGGFRDKIGRVLKDRITFVGPLEDKAGRKHAGFVGNSAAAVLRNLPDLLAFKPDMLIVSLGGNALPDTPAKVVGEELGIIVRAFLRNGTKKTVVSYIPDVVGYSDIIRQYNLAIRKSLAQIPEVKLIDLGGVVGKASKNSPFFADTSHPNRRGYEMMADRFLRDVFRIEPAKDPPSTSTVGGRDELIRDAKESLFCAYPYIDQRLGEYALAVGLLSQYGRDGMWTIEGEPTHNWGGAIYRNGVDDARFRPFEENGDGETPAYSKYATPEEGAIMLVERLCERRTLAAVERDAPEQVALCLGEDCFYGDSLREALASVRRHRKPVAAAAVGAEVEPTGKPFSFGNLGVLALVGGIFGATLLINRKKTITTI